MPDRVPKILLLYYSMYGHIFELMEAAQNGVEIGGGEAVLKQVEELIPEEKWNGKMLEAKERMREIAIAHPWNDLRDIDGLIMGTPTRFGNMCAQMRNFWDQASKEWNDNVLVGKPASVITSSATQHGGQETTIITCHITLLHLGCVIVGLPYWFSDQKRIDEIIGGSPYGASSITGSQGERMPSENELNLARDLGMHLTEIAKKLM